MWIFFVFIAFMALLVFGLFKYQKKNEERENTQNHELEKDITISASFEWTDVMEQHRYRFIADDVAQTIYIYDGVSNPTLTMIPYSKVLGYEIRFDEQTYGGIGRAIAGGLIAGGVGAIVGAQTANKKEVTSFSAIIFKNDLAEPTYVFDFTKNYALSTTGRPYQEAIMFSDNINGVIKTIIHRSGDRDQNKSNDPEINDATDDISERLRRLKAAYEDGLITESEYSEKRKELIEQI